MPTRWSRCLALTLIGSLVAGGAWAESVRVTGSAVNLRQEPRTTAPVTATLARGEPLEVLERSGDWYKVRTSSGLTGYVSARWVEPVPPAAETKPEPERKPAPAAPAPRPEAPALGVDHRDVGCVVAGRHPRLEACFTPAESVGRAQVQFRAKEDGPWYAVDMKPEGACHSTFLPKPMKTIERFHYFIEVVDRSFAMAHRPDAAPGRAYAPRVVSRESECQPGMLVAASNPNASVLVSVARDAGGNVLQAGASAAGAPAAPAGFSTDGVTFAGNGGASGSTAGAAPGAAEAGGGIGTKALVIGGGVVAVGAAVALAGGGGGEDSSGGGSGGGGGGGGSSSSLTGRWVGNAANGGGANVSFSGSGATCSGTQEMTLELVQSGTSLSGTGSSSWVTFNCNIPVPIPTDQGSSSGPLTGTVSGGSVTFRTSDQELYWTFNGTRSGSTLQGTATPSPSIAAIGAWTFTWRVSRQ